MTTDILYILIIHFFADFVFQSHEMASNKSKSLYFLSLHILEYTTVFMISGLLVGLDAGFIIWNCLAHFVIDYFTSRAGKAMWERKRVHDFFVVVGLDQLLHISLFVWTLPWLKGLV